MTTAAPTLKRSQDEIVAMVEEVKDDTFGFSLDVFLGALDFDHARPFLKKEVTAEEWAEIAPEDPLPAFHKYMAFAIGKAQDHRALSAGRSVEKLNAWSWLMGFEPSDAPYAQYGVPILKDLAERHGYPWPEDDEELARMAEGKPCHEGCREGCGS